MKKLFLILLLIVIASFSAHATEPVFRCVSMFHNDRNRIAEYQIQDFIAPSYIKRKLLKQAFYHPLMRDFVIEYGELLNDLYQARYYEAVLGKASANYKSLGFTSVEDMRGTREDILNKQVKILSIMDSQDMTIEFARDFKLIAIKAYDDTTTKKELLQTSKRLDAVIAMYSKLF